MVVERAEVSANGKIQPYIEQLQDLVSRRYPEATFGSPWYLADDEMWIIEANIPLEDDPELSAQLADVETTILLDTGLGLCVVLGQG